MNSHQRRISMTRRHMDWPLGAIVIRKTDGLLGTIFNHSHDQPHSCTVKYTTTIFNEDGDDRIVSVKFSDLFLASTDMRGKRPWWKDFRKGL